MPITTLFASGHIAATGVSGLGAQPRREHSRRTDNQFSRPGRALVTGAAPDRRVTAPSGPGAPVQVPMVTPAQPFAIRTIPRPRMGTVLKGAPGMKGRGLGQPVGSGFQQLEYTGFSPLESSPSNQPNFRAISIPRANVVPWTPGQALGATYHAHDFAPATRFFNQARSAPMWAQAMFPPQQRPLIPPVQANLLRNASNVVKRAVPAGQTNVGLYTIGYPTRASVAAQIGAGGPLAVLGGGY